MHSEEDLGMGHSDYVIPPATPAPPHAALPVGVQQRWRGVMSVLMEVCLPSLLPPYPGCKGVGGWMGWTPPLLRQDAVLLMLDSSHP